MVEFRRFSDDEDLSPTTALLPQHATVYDNGSTSQAATKLYKRRWGILALFSLSSMSNAYLWIHLNITADVLLVYYNQSLPVTNKSQAIDWLSMVYLASYVIFIIPSTWLTDRVGQRWIALLASFLNALSAWIQCLAIEPTRFWLLLASQFVGSVACSLIFGMPAAITAVWFGPDEISTATSIATFSYMFGAGLGFLIPPLVVKLHPFPHHSNNSTTYDLPATAVTMQHLFYSGAIFMTILFIVVVFIYQDKPPLPPSIAQSKLVRDPNYIASLIRLMKNRPFLLHLLTYGFNGGLLFAISTLLNPIVLANFNKEQYPNIDVDAGWIGFTITIVGMIGSVIVGIWLDRTKTFKMTSVLIYFLSFVGMLTFTFGFYLHRIWLVYVTAGLLGFALNTYYVIGFQFAAELTYPEPEGTSCGLIAASTQAFSVVFVAMMGCIMRLDGNPVSNTRNANLTACGFLLAGLVLTVFIKNNLKRQKAEQPEPSSCGEVETSGRKCRGRKPRVGNLGAGNLSRSNYTSKLSQC